MAFFQKHPPIFDKSTRGPFLSGSEKTLHCFKKPPTFVRISITIICFILSRRSLSSNGEVKGDAGGGRRGSVGGESLARWRFDFDRHHQRQQTNAMVGSPWRSGARWRRGAAFRGGRDNRRSGMDGSLRFPAESGGSLRSVELELAGARPWLNGAAPEEMRKRDGAVRRRRGRESKGRRGRGQRGMGLRLAAHPQGGCARRGLAVGTLPRHPPAPDRLHHLLVR